MPGALNVPFRALLEDFSPVMKPAHALKYVFERHGVDLSDANGRKITTCGSGVTAAFLSLGLEVLGHKNVGLYDGSWAEWAGNIDSSVDTGPSVPTRLLRETLAKNATHAA
jgi:thiosulfate/3-mercaptopyruvate sulfurtransferase